MVKLITDPLTAFRDNWLSASLFLDLCTTMHLDYNSQLAFRIIFKLCLFVRSMHCGVTSGGCYYMELALPSMTATRSPAIYILFNVISTSLQFDFAFQTSSCSDVL